MGGCGGGSGSGGGRSGGEDYFCSSVRLVLEIHHSKEEGDVVVFLVTAQVCLIRLNFVRMASFIQNTLSFFFTLLFGVFFYSI